jgi:uncharacterized protein YqeY
MALDKIIMDELKASMKSGNQLRTDTLRSLRASLLEYAKSGAKTEMTEADEIKLLNSAAKKRKDAIEMYKNAGREELAEKEELELAIILEFLPKQLSDDEISDIIKNIISQVSATGPSDMGKVMGPSMKELAGKADGNKVKTIVQNLLSSL